MERSNASCFRVCIWVLCFAMAASLFKHCDARKPIGLVKAPKDGTIKQKKLELMSTIMSLVVDQPTETSNTNPYVSSPLSLPPFESSAPNSIPENAPPYCFNPPLTPQTPSTTPSETSPAPPTPVPYNIPPVPYNIPPVLPAPNLPMTPTGIIPSPPAFSCTPYPPQVVPGPPSYIPGGPSTVPSPNQPILSPPYYEPSPPGAIPFPSPPFYIPSPPRFLPNPPVFLPPIVYPPPTVPPPPSTAPITALWCVAKPSVPDPIILEAMNYACGSGANCDSILPNGPCFEPNALFAHASYAFNSYFQRTKRDRGTCDFGGTAILVTVDPSSDGCHFDYNNW